MREWQCAFNSLASRICITCKCPPLVSTYTPLTTCPVDFLSDMQSYDFMSCVLGTWHH